MGANTFISDSQKITSEEILTGEYNFKNVGHTETLYFYLLFTGEGRSYIFLGKDLFFANNPVRILVPKFLKNTIENIGGC